MCWNWDRKAALWGRGGIWEVSEFSRMWKLIYLLRLWVECKFVEWKLDLKLNEIREKGSMNWDWLEVGQVRVEIFLDCVKKNWGSWKLDAKLKKLKKLKKNLKIVKFINFYFFMIFKKIENFLKKFPPFSDKNKFKKNCQKIFFFFAK